MPEALVTTMGSGASKSLGCIFKAQQEVEFKQTGQNRSGGSYSYFKLEDLIGPLKPVLAEFRCVLLFTTDDAEVKAGFEKIQGSKDPVPKDKLVTYAYCSVTCRIQSIDDVNDWVASSCYGYKVDQSADKALGADTVASRYAVMHMVLAGTDIDPDSDIHDVRNGGLLGSIMSEPSSVGQPKTLYSNTTAPTVNGLMEQVNRPATSADGSGLSAALDMLMSNK